MTYCSWKTSLHGGHTGEFCDHAEDRLEDLLEAAIAAGCDTYGITEHAPRVEAAWLYAEEQAMGWTVDTLERLFAAYAERSATLAAQYRGRLRVLRGFETEVVPPARYAEVMQDLRARYQFDYIVGSVHHVAGHSIDYRKDLFDDALATHGGLEGLSIAYYRTYADMLATLRPEVAAHFDLVRRHAPDEESVATPRIRDAAFATLEQVKAVGAILDINTAGYRKGLGRPYPAPWLLEEALRLGIPVCFGDDSHRASEVCFQFDAARDYLLAHGCTAITRLVPGPAGVTREVVPL